MSLPWCAPGALSSDGALGPSLRAAIAQAAADVPVARVVFQSAACAARRRALQAGNTASFDPITGVASGGSRAIVPGGSMTLTLKLMDVAEFISRAGDVAASGLPPASQPGPYFGGGFPDPGLQGKQDLLAVSNLAARLLGEALGSAMGCGTSSGAGVPGAGASAQPLSPFSSYFAAFAAATGLPPANALSCSPGTLLVSLSTPLSPPAPSPPPPSGLPTDALIGVVVGSVLGAVALCGCGYLMCVLRKKESAAPLTMEERAPRAPSAPKRTAKQTQTPPPSRSSSKQPRAAASRQRTPAPAVVMRTPAAESPPQLQPTPPSSPDGEVDGSYIAKNPMARVRVAQYGTGTHGGPALSSTDRLPASVFLSHPLLADIYESG